MVQSRPEMRIFISSTFQDLEAEREILGKRVFPLLRGLGQEVGLSVTEIDLRWGITEEDSRLGRTVRRCFEEIAECRPYFIGIIGDRYGWCPMLADVYKDPTLLTKYPWVEDAVIRDASLIEMEFLSAAESDVRQPGTYFYRRVSTGASDPKLEALVNRISSNGYEIRNFQTPEELSTLVESDFLPLVRARVQSQDLDQPTTTADAQQVFQRRHSHLYVVDADVLKRVKSAMQQDAARVVVTGPVGAGKSSFLSYFADHLRRLEPECTVVRCFVGADTKTSRLTGVLKELATQLGIEESEESSQQDLATLLARIPSSIGPAVVIIDGADQLIGDDGATGSWLPDYVPNNVRLLISTSRPQVVDRLVAVGWQSVSVPPLDVAEREALAVRYLSQYRKSLSPAQLRKLSNNANSQSPLYLCTLLEELRLVGTFEALDENIDELLTVGDSIGLFARLLARLESDYGSTAIRDILGLLWVSRKGLSREVLQVCSGLPKETVVMLLSVLDGQLVMLGHRYSLAHSALVEVIAKRYEAYEVVLRERLVSFFTSLPEDDVRRVEEEPWQLQQLGYTEKLACCIARPGVFIQLSVEGWRGDLLSYWATIQAYRTRFFEFYLRLEHAESESSALATIALLKVIRFAIDGGEFGMASKLLQKLGEQTDKLSLSSTQEGEFILLQAHLLVAIGAFEKLGPLTTQLMELATSPNLDVKFRATVLGQVGTIMYSGGRFVEAEQCFDEQVRLESLLYRPGDTKRAEAISSLGAVYLAQGRVDAARACMMDAVQLWRRQGSQDPRSAISLNNLAATYTEEASQNRIELLEEAISIVKRGYGENTPLLADYLINLASMQLDHDAPAAMAHLLQATALAERVGNKPLLATATTYLGILARHRGEFEEARSYFEEALRLREAVLGRDHPLTLNASKLIDDLSRRATLNQ